MLENWDRAKNGQYWKLLYRYNWGSVSFSESDGRCCQHHAGQAGDFEAEGSPSKGLLLFEWFERQISRPLLVWKFQTFEVSYDFQRHLRIWGWDKRTRTRLWTWVSAQLWLARTLPHILTVTDFDYILPQKQSETETKEFEGHFHIRLIFFTLSVI